MIDKNDFKRRVVYNFFSLSFVMRLKILLALNLLQEQDEGKYHYNISIEILERVEQRGLMERMNKLCVDKLIKEGKHHV